MIVTQDDVPLPDVNLHGSRNGNFYKCVYPVGERVCAPESSLSP